VKSEIDSKGAIKGVIEFTKWCINAKKNMLGMPTWGDTVQYYCAHIKFSANLRSEPGFSDIPQHLVDHDLYNEEVRGHLRTLTISWDMQPHQVTSDDIAGDLDGLSEVMETELDARGIRNGGTHSCWKAAVKNNGIYANWYEPFSMAEAPREKPFPARVESVIGTLVKKLLS
jgi:hypothetical protein